MLTNVGLTPPHMFYQYFAPLSTHRRRHTHTGKPCQSRTIFDSLNEDVHVRRSTGNWDTVCKIADTQLVYDFSALNRGPNPVHVIFSLFFNIPLYARVGTLQPFARIHPQIVDRPHLQCPQSESGVSEYVLGWRWLQTHTYTHTPTKLTSPRNTFSSHNM